jgi:hypothetical protein
MTDDFATVSAAASRTIDATMNHVCANGPIKDGSELLKTFQLHLWNSHVSGGMPKCVG